jgi:AcrR family transcriptional regulator
VDETDRAEAAAGAEAAAKRPVGRPRSVRSERAILAATRELLSERGVRGLTIEGVAARAGVGKTTIYRRWRSKEELALALMLDTAEEFMPAPELGDTRAELVALVRATAEALSDALVARVLPGLVPELASNEQLARGFREHLIGTRRNEVRAVIARGVARGDLRPDADHGLAPELLVGPVYYRFLLSGDPLDEGFAERVVDAVLAGFAPPSEG